MPNTNIRQIVADYVFCAWQETFDRNLYWFDEPDADQAARRAWNRWYLENECKKIRQKRPLLEKFSDRDLLDLLHDGMQQHKAA